MAVLDSNTIQARLAALAGWRFENNAISKTYAAGGFYAAIGFVVQIALFAEAVDHHPDLLIQYNKVTVTLSTHSAGGVTEKDFDLAGRIENAFTGESG